MKHIKENEIKGDHFQEPYTRTIKHLAAPWTLGTSKFWMGISEIEKGGKSNPHSHDAAEEVFYIISGNGRMRVGKEEEDVGPGSCVYVSPGQEHQILNTGDDKLKIIAVTSPPFKLDKFEAVHLKEK